MNMIRRTTTSTKDCDVPFSWDTFGDIDPNHRHVGKSFLFKIDTREFVPSPGQCESTMFVLSGDWYLPGVFKGAQKLSYWNKSKEHGRTVNWLFAERS
jgi:hypothetical protein